MVGGTEKNIAEKEMGNKVDLGSFTMEVTVELRPGGSEGWSLFKMGGEENFQMEGTGCAKALGWE